MDLFPANTLNPFIFHPTPICRIEVVNSKAVQFEELLVEG